jgi:hypothetical protein
MPSIEALASHQQQVVMMQEPTLELKRTLPRSAKVTAMVVITDVSLWQESRCQPWSEHHMLQL